MRAFIGIRVAANEKIRKILKELSKHACVKTVEPENLHVCLRFLGEIDDAATEEWKARLDELRGFGAFDFELAGVGAFPSKNYIRVIWIGAQNEKLIALAKMVGETRFAGHITLGRVKIKPDPELAAIFTDESFGIVRAAQVELIKSELTPKGPVYTVIHSAEL